MPGVWDNTRCAQWPGMGTGTVLAAMAAGLTPLSYIPGLARMVRKRSADGLSMTLCGTGLVSYGMWIGLATGNTPAMFAILLVSSSLALVQTVIVNRYLGETWTTLARWAGAAVAGGMLSWRWGWAGVAVLVVVDMGWYLRAVRDISRSVNAGAVSIWGWVLTIAANLAWVYDGVVREVPTVAIQSAVLTACAGIAMAVTIRAHRRT